MESIIRGTNATILMTIKDDLDFTTISALELYLYQSQNTIIKTLPDLILDSDTSTVSYELTQEESLSLCANRPVEITLIGIAGGKRFETRPVLNVRVENTRKNEVMS